MAAPVEQYLKAVERELHVGRTTEHTHRPALKQLVESLQPMVNATNEPTRVACGAPDFVVTRNPASLTIGYIETKDIDKSLDEAEDSEQLNRYRRSLANLILTDYLEFRWYVDGERRDVARLGRVGKNNRVVLEDDGETKLREFVLDFLKHKPEPITNPKQLAQRLARLTHIIRDTIVEAFEKKSESQLLRELRQAFAMRLLPDLVNEEKTPQFADMYAQTIAYGLFAARCNHKGPEPFRRFGAASEIPKTNPFLRKLFETITGTELDDEPYADFVDDLVQVLDTADIRKILAHFGARTKQEDPVVHFYETFLATYDPKLREARGVFYTPEPVVSYIVRSTDALLRERFTLTEGLTDTATVKYRVKGKKKDESERESHRVLILDPACGTGTFLYSVVDHIRSEFERENNAGMWSSYVRNHLLPRIYGFELLMAPYAVAHLKLGLQLAAQDMPPSEQKKWAYDFSGNERLGVYLTNTLEKVEPEVMPLLAHLRVISEEADAAAEIKRDLPIMVILGNPPYSNFGMMNKGEWISELMDDWKPPEEKKWNPDDFMKFIRWAQWRIEQTGAGILGFITRNTYLDGITHWRMRESLMKTFSEIYILDLHGSLRAKEKTPDGDSDKNVFDIQWGVSIGLFIKDAQSTGATEVRHADLWGEREDKYNYLSKEDVGTTKWTKVKPTAPNFYFAPRDTEGEAEYLDATALLDIFKLKNSGLQTKKDSLTIHHSESDLKAVLKDIRADSVETLRKNYKLGADGRDWAVASAKDDVIESKGKIFKLEYRPFDTRFSYYTGKTKGFIAYPRADVTAHLLRPNIALVSMRQIAGVPDLCEAFVTRNPVTDRSMASTLGTPYMFPLYIYRKAIPSAAEEQLEAFDASPYATADAERVPNLDEKLIFSLEKRLKWKFEPFGSAALKSSFGAEDVLAYIYAITYSPTYRSRYQSFLAKDYPRIPFTSDQGQFRKLVLLGRELIALHLLESPKVQSFKTSFPVPGSNDVAKAHPHYYPPASDMEGGKHVTNRGRVYINQQQYFDGVSEEVWTFQIGGYQVCDRWLRDRQRHTLGGYDDLTHYQQLIAAVSETLGLMEQIDAAIPNWPMS